MFFIICKWWKFNNFSDPLPPNSTVFTLYTVFFWMSSLRNKYHLSVIHFLRIIFESLSAFPRSMLIQFSLVTKWRPVLLHFLRLLWTMTKPAETGAEVATDYNCGWVLTLSHFLTLLSPRLQSVSLTSSNIHSMDSFKCRKSIYTQEIWKSISKCISFSIL